MQSKKIRAEVLFRVQQDEYKINLSPLLNLIADIFQALLLFLSEILGLNKKNPSNGFNAHFPKKETYKISRGDVLGEEEIIEVSGEPEPAMASDTRAEVEQKFAWDLGKARMNYTDLSHIGNCKTCSTPLYGKRKGAVYCSERCKSIYHNRKPKM